MKELVERIINHGKKIGFNDHQTETVLEVFEQMEPDARRDFVSLFETFDCGQTLKGGYCYTVGLTKHSKVPHVMVVFHGGNNVYASILDELRVEYPDAAYPEHPISVETARIKVGELEVKLRVQIVKSSDPKGDIHRLFPRISQWTGEDPKDIYHVLLGDANNRLPGEEGYNEDLVQTPDGVDGVNK